MIRIVSNCGLPARWETSGGETGQSVEAHSSTELLAAAREPDSVLLVNCDPRLAFDLAAVSLTSFRSPPLVSVDLVLRRPRSATARLTLPLKRFLLSRFGHHIHYFQDFRGLDEVYGIGSTSSYVPFKANLRYRHSLDEVACEGEYVLSFGRSMRDYDTFFAAMEKLPFSGAIPRLNPADLNAHGARFSRSLDQLPGNVAVLDDDGTDESMVRILGSARLVVLPILKSSIVASGISTCLNSMLMGKCVIGSEGPGMSDIFSGEVLTVPAEDAGALAAMIRRAWEDASLRHRIAAAGHRFAMDCGGEPELYQRIIDRVASWYRGTFRPRGKSRQ